MDYLNLDKDIFYSLINMKLRDKYEDLEDLCLSENIDLDAMRTKLKECGLEYDRENNRLYLKKGT